MKKRAAQFFAGCISLIIITTVQATSLPSPLLGKFLSIADIHFDPFTICHLGVKACPLIADLQRTQPEEWASIFESEGANTGINYYHDTSYSLLKITLIKIHSLNQSEHFNFVLLLGDSLGHMLRFKYILYSHDYSKAGFRSFINKIQNFLSQELQLAIPTIDIFPIIGNNDSYTGDYSVVPGGAFLKDTTENWSSLIRNKENRNNFIHQFPYGGYYETTLQTNAHQKIIILNSVLFGNVTNQSMQKAANKQLEWLHEQLISAHTKHQTVFIAFHIPIGVNIYNTLKNPLGEIQEFWNKEYSNLFRQYINEFSGSISAILAAHIHIQALQFLIFNPPRGVYVTYTPSISPIFGNSPGFKLYRYDLNSFQIKGSDTYFYSFNHHTGQLDWQK